MLGQASLLVDLLFVLTVPLAAVGGYRFLRALPASRPAAVWGAVGYGLLPVLGGAWQQGRLGTVVGLLVLPWLAHAALGLHPTAGTDRRWRAAWRTGLWNAVLVAFVPLAGLMVAVAAVAALAAGLVADRRAWGRPAVPAAVLVAVLAPLVLLLPWTWPTLTGAVPTGSGGWAALAEAGLRLPSSTGTPDGLDLVLGRLPGAAAPALLSLPVVPAAAAALLRGDTRPAVLRAWLVVLVALGTVAVLTPVVVVDPVTGVAQPLWLGFPVLAAQAAALTAAVLAASGLRQRLRGADFGARQTVGAVVSLLAVLGVAASTAWWVGVGAAVPLERSAATTLPAYLRDAATSDPRSGVLVLSGRHGTGYDYVLVHDDGLRLGDDSVMPTARQQRGLTAVVADLVAAPRRSDVVALRRQGVAHVFAPAPVDERLAATFDGAAGLVPGSAPRGAGAWQVSGRPASGPDRPASGTTQHGVLLAGQGLAVLAALVLALPGREVRP